MTTEGDQVLVGDVAGGGDTSRMRSLCRRHYRAGLTAKRAGVEHMSREPLPFDLGVSEGADWLVVAFAGAEEDFVPTGNAGSPALALGPLRPFGCWLRGIRGIKEAVGGRGFVIGLSQRFWRGRYSSQWGRKCTETNLGRDTASLPVPQVPVQLTQVLGGLARWPGALPSSSSRKALFGHRRGSAAHQRAGAFVLRVYRAACFLEKPRADSGAVMEGSDHPSTFGVAIGSPNSPHRCRGRHQFHTD